MNKEINPATKLLATQLAAAFAQVGADCIPAIEKYMRESEEPREVSFGARVRFWTDKEDRLRAQLVAKSPKLPTVELEDYDFTLSWQGAQLAFDFVGAPSAAAPAVPAEPAATSAPTPAAAIPATVAAPQSGNGAAPPEPPKEPLPPMVGRCPDLDRTGDHGWRPIDDQPGMMFCMCGARGRIPAAEATT